MSSYQRALWTLAVCTLFATLCRATSDNSTSTGAFDTALEPLYQMTDGFLRLVFPASGISVETLSEYRDSGHCPYKTPVLYTKSMAEVVLNPRRSQFDLIALGWYNVITIH